MNLLVCSRTWKRSSGMPAEAGPETDQVSPLELFFDLVLVFAVSQLSHQSRTM
jgi:low temperature requirement protein LtrA